MAKRKVTPPKRRYRIGEEPEYDRLYDKYLLTSPVINPDHRNPGGNTMGMSFNTKGYILRELYKYEGEISGDYKGMVGVPGKTEDEYEKSYELTAREKLQELQQSYENRL